jgi:tetratricopeptide (TPR) repeat protein
MEILVELEPDSPISDRIGGGQSRSYSVALEAGQYLEAVVDQQGVEVEVRVSDPAGQEVLHVAGLKFDWQNWGAGPQSVFLLANLSGPYRLDVTTLKPGAASGNYQVRLVRRGVPTEDDRDRAEAARLVTEAERLFDSPDAYAHAADLFHRSGALVNEMYALRKAAAVSYKDITRRFDCYERGLAVARQLKDRHAEICFLELIGAGFLNTLNQEKATEYFEQMLAIAREWGYGSDQALALNYLGNTCEIKQIEKRIAYFEQALAISQAGQDLCGQSYALGNLGATFTAIGDYSKAVHYDEQALPLLRARKDQRGEGLALVDLGTSYEALGQHQKSLDAFESALAIARDAGDRALEAGALNGIATANRGLSQ